MQSTLTLTANFVDVTKPTVAITSPLAGSRVTNGTVTVQGTASDNNGVAQVLVQLGSGPFQVATGTANWSASLALAPGPNTVVAKSVETAGNQAAPVSETITYAILSQIALSANGNGSISPNLNGQLLEVGKSYTVTALPASGNAFTNWTGGIAANTAVLTFVMQSNLSLTANFIDVTKPTVAITSPLDGSRVTNGAVTVQGTASDNNGVAQVLVQLGSGPFQVATGTANWSASLALAPGPNTVVAKSVETAGNQAAPVSETITYAILSQIALSANGNGSISPNLNGQLLEVGKSYTVTALPASGNAFTNWTGGIAANTAVLTFVMQSNLSLTANFIDVTKPTVAITSPLDGSRVTNGAVTVQGTASDNNGVAQVLVQLGSGPFQVATGTANWSASLALAPGPNTVVAKSVETAGNQAAPVSETITYAILSQIALSANGNGSISPNLNGQLLEVGKSYTVTALPASGNAFTNWTGGIAANTAVLTFVMQSNLSLTANFIDVTKPTVAITSPLDGSRVTNGAVTVQGTASDNNGVAQVLVQLGSGPFQVATGTANWSASLALAPGPNTVVAKSVETAGNQAAPVSETITYAILSQIALSANGNGSISPNLNGQLLEVGKSYTVTALPASGNAFTNWTGGIAANTAVLTFVMQSNLSLTANFIDVTKPTVAITSPLDGSRVTNGAVTVQGTASDNNGVAQVLVQLGSGPFQVATGTANWSASLALAPGPNTVVAKSVDTAGNQSAPVSETITYAILSQITLSANGNGSISPNLNGQLLEVGKSYTVTALPASGNAFTNWTGGIAANTAVLTFVMQSNLSLTANFIDVTKPTVAITSPLDGSRVTNGTVTVQGTASDNNGVAQVLVQLGSGPFQVATGTANWSASLALAPGPNTVVAKSVDTAGNQSAPVSETITYAILSQITLSANGNGSISPNLNGQFLEVGKSYTLTALPASGNAFTNWTGGIPANTAVLTFVMQSNLT